jgi:hypothetical protein
MPKVSGYQQAKERILSTILETEPKELTRSQVAVMLDTSISSAGNYLQMLASEYPNTLDYKRGNLTILSSIPMADMPPQALLEAKNRKINQVKELTNRIMKNHLNHYDKKKLIEALQQLQARVDEL